MTSKYPAAWGEYAPPPQSFFLRFLIAIGLGRGDLRTKILQRWGEKYGKNIDISRRGVKYRLDISNNVTDGKILASSVVYDKKELSYLKSACQDGVFVDVGANIGYYSLVLAHECHCRVVAIEPNPPTLQRLRFNVDANENLQERISIVALGVGPEGEFELHSDNNLGAASLHGHIFSGSNNAVKIQTKPLAEILRDERIDKVDGLKIDIEGMEDQALGPFISTADQKMLPRCIVIEDDQKHLWKTDLMKQLADRGYVEKARTQGNAILQLAQD
jgi:FkbM family methyltransferase